MSSSEPNHPYRAMTEGTTWEDLMSPTSTDPPESPRIFDLEAAQLFGFLLPELAASAQYYYPAGPDAVRFVSGDGHSFLWTIRSKRTKDPFDTEWTLECRSDLYRLRKEDHELS